MDFDDVWVVSGTRDTATAAEIATAEAALGTHFPAGYREYVTTLGAGIYGEWVHVFLPTAVVRETAEYRPVLETLGAEFWEAGLAVLPRDRLVQCIQLGRTDQGDQIVFHPDAPGDLYVLPHSAEEIYRIGGTLDEALTWLLEGDTLGDPIRYQVLTPTGAFVDRVFRFFEPYAEREIVEFQQFDESGWAQVRAFLVARALDRREDCLCVRRLITDDDGQEVEWLYLYEKDYGGYIYCIPASNTVSVTYDGERRTDRLSQVLAFVDSVAGRRYEESSRDMVWDRQERVWRETAQSEPPPVEALMPPFTSERFFKIIALRIRNPEERAVTRSPLTLDRLIPFPISYPAVLIRSPRNDQDAAAVNIDIVFGFPTYLQVATLLQGLELREISAEEARAQGVPLALATLPGGAHERCYQISSGGQVYYITAYSCDIGENRLPATESSL